MPNYPAIEEARRRPDLRLHSTALMGEAIETVAFASPESCGLLNTTDASTTCGLLVLPPSPRLAVQKWMHNATLRCYFLDSTDPSIDTPEQTHRGLKGICDLATIRPMSITFPRQIDPDTAFAFRPYVESYRDGI